MILWRKQKSENLISDVINLFSKWRHSLPGKKSKGESLGRVKIET